MRHALRLVLIGIFVVSTAVALLVGYFSVDWLTRESIQRNISGTNAAIIEKFRTFDVLLEREEAQMEKRMKAALPLVVEELLGNPPSFSTRTPEQIAELSRRVGVDNIYIIDKNTVVVATDFQPDMGFKLGEISGDLRSFLSGLMGTGRFAADRLNFSSKTGILQKYGYLSPPGSDYIAEVSIDVRKFLARERSEAFVRFLFGSFSATSSEQTNTWPAWISIWSIRWGCIPFSTVMPICQKPPWSAFAHRTA